jgi:23S rRNA (cytidine1920-2'-O)/16S rRNA (cytidine1409-2'-O)-methyltransferase
MRLDNYLVENNLADSRTKAQEIIKNSLVSVEGVLIKKSSFKVDGNSLVEVAEHESYVSRAAYKLKYFLEEIDLDIHDAQCLDIGSSTGGFTQVLLENGARSVDAVDVGKAQLHKRVLEDERVVSYESCDIREFTSEKDYDVVVSDVSFISLSKILDDIDRLANKDMILLFKPQFEVGRDVKRDKNGVVLDDKAIKNAMDDFEAKCIDKKWNLLKKSPSKITGKEGNLEYCYHFRK